MKVFVATDENRSESRLVRSLQGAGCLVDVAASVEEAKTSLLGRTYDAILLDLGPANADALRLLRWLRSRRDQTPVSLLAEQGALARKLEAFDAGADHYLVKPFALEELLARLRVQVRHTDGRNTDIIEICGVRVDLALRRVTRGEAIVDLTAKEFAVLASLVRRATGIVSKAELEDQLYDESVQVESNTVEVAICALRRKLGRKLIVTARGLGYTVSRLTAEAA